MRAGSFRWCALVTVLVCASGAGVSAHRYDELLQAARIGVEIDRVRVEVDLTPGMAIADAVMHEIDVDDDGVLSSAEQGVYAEHVRRRLTLRVDDSQPFPLSLVEASFPEPAAMRTGDAAIRLRTELRLPRFGSGVHRLTFRNDHVPAQSVYLANALVPDSLQVAVTAQRRDVDQRELIVGVEVRAAPRSTGRWAWAGGACVLLLAAVWTRRLGLEPASGERRSSLSAV